MSSLFERAIADAKELKETALKNAEQIIIEKYSSELKEAVENLLEQDEDEELEAAEEETPEGGEEMAMDMEMDAEPAEPTGDDSLMNQVPDAATMALAQALEDDQDEIVIDFDELMSDYEATAPEEEAEQVPAGAESAIDREEMLDEVRQMKQIGRLKRDLVGRKFHGYVIEDVALVKGKPVVYFYDDEGNFVWNFYTPEMIDEEAELDEALAALTEEQIDALLEEVNVDIKSQHPNNGWAGSTSGDRAENVDLAALAAALEEEQEKNKELEEQTKMLSERLQEAKNKLKKAKEVLIEMKTKTAEVNLQNAKLYYTTQTLTSKELNTRQKDKIVESLAKAKTIEETKLVYETLKESVGSTKETAPKSLVETVNRTRSLVLSAQKREEKKEASPMYENWKKLAGIKK